jgi:hypothetical protein
MLTFVLVAGTQAGGWMQRLKDQGKDPAKPLFGAPASNDTAANDEPVVQEVVSMTKPGITRKITKEELAEHTGVENPWFVVKGEVRTTWIKIIISLLIARSDRSTTPRSTSPNIQEALSQSPLSQAKTQPTISWLSTARTHVENWPNSTLERLKVH